jgi:hypothetical protein
MQSAAAIFGKFCISAAFVVVYVLTAESFPTQVMRFFIYCLSSI